LNNNEIFLDAAIKIGSRLAKNAIWNGNNCTWNIFAPEINDPRKREGKYKTASSSVYQGVAGIGIYLSELYKATKDDKIKNVIIGAVNFCNTEIENLPKNSFGFHSGKVGIAYFLSIAGTYLADESFIRDSKTIINSLQGHETEESGLDVIGGAAGAIPALIKISRLIDSDTAINLAINLGEYLINKACKEPIGWSWGTKIHTFSIRNLCGFAHGAAGFGHAFLELSNLTNSDYFLYAAEQAFLYERSFYSEIENNWPDLRYQELSEYTTYKRFAELKEVLIKNELSPYKPHYMSAWCHGAPGIGLSRLRGYELTLNNMYLEESLKACENTIKSINIPQGNYSLCHGIFGNAETLLEASITLKNDHYLSIIEQKASEAIENYGNGGKPWPCGTVNSTNDPSLLVGEAGIGYFLLRLADKSVPSILAIKNDKPISNIKTGKTKEILQRDYINLYFGNTLKHIDNSEDTSESVFSNIQLNSGDDHSDIEIKFRFINEHISSSDDNLKPKLSDIFMLEKEIYLSSKANLDFSREYLEKLIIPDINIDWNKSLFILHPDCKLVSTIFDKESSKQYNSDFGKEEHCYLIYKEGNDFKEKRISQFNFKLFSILKTPCLIAAIIESVFEMFEIEKDQHSIIEKKIKEQISIAVKSNIVKVNNN
jgi:lantibiotic biosynthesis protein